MSRDKEFKKAAIFDVHGTLMDKHGGLKKSVMKDYEKQEKKGHEIIVMSTEPSSEKKGTEKWLDSHDIKYDKFITRPKGDTEPDHDVKKALYEKDVKPKYKVTKAYDDKKSNAKMLKKQGIKTKIV